MFEIFGIPSTALFGQLLIGLINGSFYALLSLGLAVIFGMLNIINFSHGAQYMMGAFAAYLILQYSGLGYRPALIIAPILVGITGILVERFFLQWLYKLDHLYGLLLTFGLALILEGPYADDAPPAEHSAMQCRLGGGVHVRLYDPTMVTHPRLAEFVLDVARSHGIPHQVAVWAAGGTDAGVIHQSGPGVPSIVLGVPVRYIHSHVSVLHLDDYEAARSLVFHLVAALDRTAVERILGASRPVQGRAATAPPGSS